MTRTITLIVIALFLSACASYQAPCFTDKDCERFEINR